MHLLWHHPSQGMECKASLLCLLLFLQLTRGHQVALSSISYVGCSLSVLCLAATLVTFAVLS